WRFLGLQRKKRHCISGPCKERKRIAFLAPQNLARNPHNPNMCIMMYLWLSSSCWNEEEEKKILHSFRVFGFGGCCWHSTRWQCSHSFKPLPFPLFARHQMLVLFLTYLTYMSFHLSRKV